MSLKEIPLKCSYESYECDLINDFYNPTLSETVLYKRIAGFFTSASIQLASRGFAGLIKNKGKIMLLVSPLLNQKDVETLIESTNSPEKYIEKIMISEIEATINKDSFFALGWLIANDILDIRVVCIKKGNRYLTADEIDKSKIMHQKIGIMQDSDGNIVSFSGSINETKSAWISNLEEFKVFKSWDVMVLKNYIQPDLIKFEEIWNGRRKYIKVFKPSQLVKKLIDISPKEYADISYAFADDQKKEIDWSHQEKAMNAFLKKENGILQMATGTGKTRTTFKIISKLIQDNKVNSIILCIPGNDLARQWYLESIERCFDSWILYRNYNGIKEASKYSVFPEKSILIIQQLNVETIKKTISKLSKDQKERTLIVFDEAHNMGSKSKILNLEGYVKAFRFRLGLSATPARNDDDIGDRFIREEIGEVVYEFNIEDAIKKGILCELDYVPIEYELTNSEKNKHRKLLALLKRKKDKNELTYDEEEKIRWQMAKIRKLAINKLPKYTDFLEKHPGTLNNCIIFTEEVEYAERVQEIIFKYEDDFFPYYRDAEPKQLERFARGELLTLITCQKINEGIDIKSCSTIVLFSSDKFMKTTVQRIGRCLRTDDKNPNKRALVIDFVDYNSRTDIARKEWIEKLARVKYEYK